MGNKEGKEEIAERMRMIRGEIERVDDQILRLLNDRARMAQEVGMERTHLYRKLRSVGVEVRERR